MKIAAAAADWGWSRRGGCPEKTFSLPALRKMSDFVRHVRIFPLDSVRFFFHFFGDGVRNKVAAIGR